MVPKPICGIFTPSFNLISGMSDNCARQVGGVTGVAVFGFILSTGGDDMTQDFGSGSL